MCQFLQWRFYTILTSADSTRPVARFKKTHAYCQPHSARSLCNGREGVGKNRRMRGREVVECACKKSGPQPITGFERYTEQMFQDLFEQTEEEEGNDREASQVCPCTPWQKAACLMDVVCTTHPR